MSKKKRKDIRQAKRKKEENDKHKECTLRCVNNLCICEFGTFKFFHIRLVVNELVTFFKILCISTY